MVKVGGIIVLVLSRWTSKGGLSNLWEVLESEKKNLYWQDAEPLYALQQEGKGYISLMLSVKNLKAIQKIFNENARVMAEVMETRTIPVMSPIYFPLPKGHRKDLNRYMAFLRVSPEKYSKVRSDLIGLRCPKDVHITYLSYSFGDDDMIVSLLAKDRATALAFAGSVIGKIKGVDAFDIARVVKYVPLLPASKLKAHRAQFLYSTPTGKKGRMANPEAYRKYLKERAVMPIIVRLFAKKSLAKLWEDIENNLPKLESKDLIPLYASQQEAKDCITVIFEAANFEVLKELLTDNLPTMVDVRKSRTIPMLDPTYFLLQKEHPKDLERYLISLRVEPKHYQSVRSRIVSYDFPDNVFLTYLTYTLGQDDILLSILTDSRRSALDFTKKAFDQMEGVRCYEMSNQLKTKRLTSEKVWKRHQGKFLSSYDKQHKKDYDRDYDWSNEFYEYATMSGAFVNELDG